MNINLFWSNFDGEKSLSEWINSEIEFTPFHALTLLSHGKIKNNVNLYIYQTCTKKFKGITIKNANDIYPAEDAYSALKSGHTLAHVSDAVRFRASAKNLGVVLDMDAVMLRQFPDVDSFIGTGAAKRTGGFAPKWGKNCPPLPVPDGSWDGKAILAFPLRVSELSRPLINNIADHIIEVLAEPPKKNQSNFVMLSIREISDVDKTTKIFPPMSFCPVPFWKYQGIGFSIESPTRFDGDNMLFGHILPSVDEIFYKSYIIQHFFESIFKSKKRFSAERFWYKVKPGSLVSHEARRIAGPEWRKVLHTLTE